MKVLGIIMAGGKGERLFPLTKERSKPAVPFGGKYRIIDFVLSNFINSEVFSSYVLVQYLSQSLIDYVRQSWRSSGITQEQFITIVPPQMRLGEVWYRGTADAVRQNLNLIKDFHPDIVAIFGADHIYRMDIKAMVDFHVKNNADVTVSALPVPIEQASSFGIVSVDTKNRLTGFVEKPKNPQHIPGDPGHAFCSMGNYLFSFDSLIKILHEKYAETPGLDFGQGILPMIHKRYRVFAYDFKSAKLPGLKPHEEQGYWRDVGTIQAFWDAHMDMLGTKPKMELNNPDWPIRSASFNSPPAKYTNSVIEDSMISDGCIISNSTIKHSIIGRNITIEDNCEIEDCIIMDKCTIKAGSKIKKAIIDRFNTIPAKTKIGHNIEEDSQHYYIDPSGIVLIPRGISKFQ